MINRVRKVEADGSVSVSVTKLTRTIRAADGTIRNMVSFDGVAWRLAANEDQEALRLKRSANILNSQRIRKNADGTTSKTAFDGHPWRPQAWTQKKQKELRARINPGTTTPPGPVILPVEHHGSPILGKAKGKNQKHRRNLKRKKEQNVQFVRPVHTHRCHGEKVVCSCDTPWKRIRCGGTYCLVAIAIEENIKLQLKTKGDLEPCR